MCGDLLSFMCGRLLHRGFQSKGFMSAADTETLVAFEPTRFLVVDDNGILYVSK